MIPLFVKVRSWHIWDRHYVSRANRPMRTLCGQRPKLGAPESDTLPAGEKSCESCLANAKRRETA